MDGDDSKETPGHRALQDEAVAWLVRRDSGEWTQAAQARLDAWLATSTAHRVAFLRVEAGWEGAARLKALGAGHSPGSVPPLGAWGQSPFFEPSPRSSGSIQTRAVERIPRRPWFAMAAAVVLALGAAAYFHRGEPGDRYNTPIGGVAVVPLQDGSNITLSTRTEVRVELNAKERRIELDRGEAFFQVAKDPTRPFVVRAGDKRIVAVGTQFSVRRTGDDVRVVVTEGTVRFETVALTAGSVARAREQDLLVQREPLPVAEQILSWRQGYLTFHDTPLGEALSEFNRYNAHQVNAADPQTAAIQISGMFRPTHYEAFVRLVQDGYGLKARTSADTTVLSRE